MTALLVALLATGPCVYWTQGVDSKPVLDAARRHAALRAR